MRTLFEDSFTGSAGVATGHTPEVGVWSTSSSANFQLDGFGYAGTSVNNGTVASGVSEVVNAAGEALTATVMVLCNSPSSVSRNMRLVVADVTNADNDLFVSWGVFNTGSQQRISILAFIGQGTTFTPIGGDYLFFNFGDEVEFKVEADATSTRFFVGGSLWHATTPTNAPSRLDGDKTVAIGTSLLGRVSSLKLEDDYSLIIPTQFWETLQGTTQD